MFLIHASIGEANQAALRAEGAKPGSKQRPVKIPLVPLFVQNWIQ
jgi:hypothetical protein